MCSLFLASGFRRPDEIAEYIQTELDLDTYDDTALKRYARGSQFPVKGGHPYACGDWVKLAARVWPDTGAWFRTPFWFLTSKASPTPDDLVACAEGLPVWFRENLLEPAHGTSALRLIPISRDYLYGLVDLMNPWSLGALACAMRRAELAADVGTVRWACVGILWAVNYFLDTTDPLMHPPLEKLRSILKSHFNAMTYPMQVKISAPVSEADIARFASERDAFVKYFEIGDFGDLDPGTRPPWIELGNCSSRS